MSPTASLPDPRDANRPWVPAAVAGCACLLAAFTIAPPGEKTDWQRVIDRSAARIYRKPRVAEVVARTHASLSARPRPSANSARPGEPIKIWQPPPERRAARRERPAMPRDQGAAEPGTEAGRLAIPDGGRVELAKAPGEEAGLAPREPRGPGATEGAAPVQAEPPPAGPPLLAFSGMDLFAAGGKPQVSLKEGALAFEEASSGNVVGSVASVLGPGSGAPAYNLSFNARLAGDYWELAVDSRPAPDAGQALRGTTLVYRRHPDPAAKLPAGLILAEDGATKVKYGYLTVDQEWHKFEVDLKRRQLAVSVDGRQVLMFRRRRPSAWIGFSGNGEFKDLTIAK